MAAALNVTVPLPLPLAPLVTVSHDELLLTPSRRTRPAPSRAVDPVPPPAATDWLVGEIEYVQPRRLRHGERLAGDRRASRCADSCSLLAAALNATVPLPLPLAPLVTVSHACCCSRRPRTAGRRRHAVEPVPPPAATDWLVGEIV